MRSLFFAPANHERRVERIADFGADAVVLDLEDAVAVSDKAAARQGVQRSLAGINGPVRCVRINSFKSGLAYADLDAVVGLDLDVVVLPKADSSEETYLLDAELTRLEIARGLDPGAIEIMPLLESAVGVMNAESIAMRAPSRMRRLAFGLADYSTELGITVSPDGRELLYARSRIVNASAAAGLEPPLDGPYLDIKDNDGLLFDTRASWANGFRGRVVIYPGQIESVHRGYSQATEAEVHRSRRIVEEFQIAEAEGNAAIQVDGEFVDAPIYRRASTILKQHAAYERERS